MSEENTKSQNGDSTNPLPFEDFVRQQFTAISTRFDNLSGEVNSLRQEMIERFVQLSRQIRELDTRVGKVEERVEDIDYKLDDFIKEQIRIKREWREFQERQTSQ
jgi:chromosome segregation ATPase